MGIMASRPLHLRCKDTRVILGYMTAAVSAYERSPSRWQIINLMFLRIRFHYSFGKLTSGRPSMSDVEHCWSQPPTPDSEALAAEHLLYLATFANFIDVLLQKLDRRRWRYAGSEEDQGFKVLWGMLFDTCSAFTTFPNQWRENHVPHGHPIYFVANAIMRYLLPLVCPRSDTVSPWAPPLGRAVTANENRVMIMPAFLALSNMFNTEPELLLSSMRVLPKDYVQTLCLLACQRMNAPIPNPMLVAGMFAVMAKSVAFWVQVAVAFGSRRDIAPLRTPAVLDVMRRGCVALVSMDAPQEVRAQFENVLRTLDSS